MRELKFRAWHPEWGEMVNSSGSTVFEKREFYPFCFEVGFSHYPHGDGWVLMQYTGLKDTNGKEIYEGDLLAFRRVRLQGNKPYKRVHEVVWHESGFCLKQKLTKSLPGFIPLAAREIEENQLEVAGNIYENPELLKVG